MQGSRRFGLNWSPKAIEAWRRLSRQVVIDFLSLPSLLVMISSTDVKQKRLGEAENPDIMLE